MKHEHSWEPYTDVPVSEPKGKYWRCSECNVIGHVKPAMMRSSKAHPKRVFPYRCYKQGCKELGIDRLPGRGARGTLVFCCEGHKKKEGTG